MEIKRQQIYDKVVEILQQNCHVDIAPIDSEMRLQEDLGLDSVGLFTLAVEVENYWQLFLEEPEEDPPSTVGEVVSLIEQRLREQQEGKQLDE